MSNQSRYIRIVNTACDIIRREGVYALTRQRIAEEAEVAAGLISHYFGTISELADTIMLMATECGDAQLLARGLAVRHPLAMAASPEDRREAIRYLTKEIMGAGNGSTKEVPAVHISKDRPPVE